MEPENIENAILSGARIVNISPQSYLPARSKILGLSSPSRSLQGFNSPVEIIRVFLIPQESHEGFSFPTEAIRTLVNPHKSLRIFNLQQWSQDFSFSKIKDLSSPSSQQGFLIFNNQRFLESPASIKDSLPPAAVKDFIISS